MSTQHRTAEDSDDRDGVGVIVTAWDGHLRVDRAADGATVTLTLLTVEPTAEASVRADLVAGFVTDDADGPPTRVTVATPQGRLPEDVAALLGSRVAGAVATLVDAGGAGLWLQLDLVEVDDLAAAWAPYRARVLRAAPSPATAPATTSDAAVGSWAGGLWTSLELPSWPDLVGAPSPFDFRAGHSPVEPHRPVGHPVPVFRGGTADPPGSDPNPPVAAGRWLLPAPMADEAGCGRTISWSLRPGADGTLQMEVEVDAEEGDRAGAATLLTGVDDPGGTWEPLRAEGPGRLRARLTIRDGGSVAVRFRTGPGS